MVKGVRVGRVALVGSHTSIHNLESRMLNTSGSAIRIDGSHHFGKSHHARECELNPPLLSHVRIVYIDTRKVRWCSVGSVAFHWFAWPRETREVRGIARTLFTNHCGWVGVLIVRGRCFGPSKYFLWANRILEKLLWNWASAGRPYMVYNEEVRRRAAVIPFRVGLRDVVHTRACVNVTWLADGVGTIPAHCTVTW